MCGYAYIRNGFVENTIVWDGKTEYNPGEDVQLIEITPNFKAQIGDAYIDGTLYPKPDRDYEYTFDKDSFKWSITSESALKKAKDEAASSLLSATSEYNNASFNITALQQRIEDDDYDDVNTEESVSALKAKWMTYRKALRAYISADDGTKPLPKSPFS